jgi:hypothetical protein
VEILLGGQIDQVVVKMGEFLNSFDVRSYVFIDFNLILQMAVNGVEFVTDMVQNVGKKDVIENKKVQSDEV